MANSSNVENPSPLRSSPRLAALRREVEKSPTTKNSEAPTARLFSSTPLSSSIEIGSQEDGSPANDSMDLADKAKKHATMVKRRAYMKAYRQKGSLARKGKGDENGGVAPTIKKSHPL